MKNSNGDKTLFLAARRALHPHPERIQDRLFRRADFFDPRDVIQVRYEIIRRYLFEGQSVTKITRAFGISRQTFYMLLRMFQEGGISGLLPRQRGPFGAHKCNGAILEFAAARREECPERSIPDLVAEIAEKFGVRINPRTLERNLRRRKKTLLDGAPVLTVMKTDRLDFSFSNHSQKVGHLQQTVSHPATSPAAVLSQAGPEVPHACTLTTCGVAGGGRK
jgi:transposase